MKPEKTHRPMGLRRKIFTYFIGFTLFVLVLLWLFQSLFLDNFYYAVNRARMDRLASLLISSDVGKLEDMAEEHTGKNDTCIHVYELVGEDATQLLTVPAEQTCVVHCLSSKQMRELYERAVANDGSIFTTYELREGDYLFAWERGRERPPEALEKEIVIRERLLYARLVSSETGDPYLVMLDCPFAPIESTVRVIQMQLAGLSVVLLLVATGLATLISRHIASPIVAINREAKKLSQGTYPADYRTGGYAEIAELSQTLGEAAVELGKVDRMQKELIANISHDLRTPLTMIVGYAEVMRDIEGENTPENLQVIIDEANRLSSMVRDLVALARYQGNAEVLQAEPFSLSALTEELCLQYESLTETEGYTFLTQIAPDCRVCADRLRITQVLRNLLDNAVNYAGEDRQVEVSLSIENGAALVRITDHGAGIAEEDLPHIWERYYRVDREHHRSVVGSGLGLSIVRANLELHGARYGVLSTLGVGSTFWFSLPLSE